MSVPQALYINQPPAWYETLAKNLGTGFGDQLGNRVEMDQLQQVLSSLGQGASPESMQQSILMSNVRPETKSQFLQGVVGPAMQQQSVSSLERGLGFQPGSLQGVNDDQLKTMLHYLGQQQKTALDHAPVPPAFANFIGSEEFKRMSPDQAYSTTAQMFGKDLAEQARKMKENDRKADIETTKVDVDIHKLTDDYAKNVREKADMAKDKLRSIEVMKKSVEKKGFGTFSPDAIFGKLRLEGLKSADAAVFESASKSLYQGFREMFGGVLSDSDMKLIASMLPNLNKSKEGNLAILNFFEKGFKMQAAKGDIYKKLIKERGKNGLRPAGFDDMVEEEFDSQYGDQIRQTFESIKKQYTQEFGNLPQDPGQPPEQAQAQVSAENLPALKEGHTWMTKDGKMYQVPNGQINLAEGKGAVIYGKK